MCFLHVRMYPRSKPQIPGSFPVFLCVRVHMHTHSELKSQLCTSRGGKAEVLSSILWILMLKSEHRGWSFHNLLPLLYSMWFLGLRLQIFTYFNFNITRICYRLIECWFLFSCFLQLLLLGSGLNLLQPRQHQMTDLWRSSFDLTSFFFYLFITGVAKSGRKLLTVHSLLNIVLSTGLSTA